MKWTPALILSILVILVGVFFFAGAVGGLFFDAATPAMDPGLWSVVIVLIVLGAAGVWASMADQRAH